MTAERRARDPWNGRAARGVAALVLFAVIAILVYLHRYELFVRKSIDTSGLSPQVEACVTERLSRLDDQVARGVVTQEMAGPMRESMVDFCKETAGGQ